MSVHNFSHGSLPHKTSDDIKTLEIRKIVEESPSISVLAVVGHEMCKAILARQDDLKDRQIVEDLMVVFSIIQNKSNEVRALSNQLKNMLNIKGDLKL